MKQISTETYEALYEALATFTWFKRRYRKFLHVALGDRPELLAGLDFDGSSKREVAEELVATLARKEGEYGDVTLRLMNELCALDGFPDIEQLTEPLKTEKLEQAKAAVQRLRVLTARQNCQSGDRLRAAAKAQARAAQAAASREFDKALDSLRTRFRELGSSNDPRKRGYQFERLLFDIFELYDMEPHLGYRTDIEQIDGSINFDTDNYIVEAKWTSATVSREVADAFVMKVDRKGKNALGILISVNGFSAPALQAYNTRTSFMTLDGQDLMLVLDGRIRLDELLLAKKRHANETGSCYLPASQWLA